MAVGALLVGVLTRERHLPAHLRLGTDNILARRHGVLVQRTPRAGGMAVAVGKDAAAVNHLGFHVVFFIPLKPRLKLSDVPVGQERVRVFGAQLPILRRQLRHRVIQIITILLIGHIGAVVAAANLTDLLVHAQALRSAETARPGGLHPGQVNSEGVQRILRVYELEPLAGKIRRYFTPRRDGFTRGRACRKT